MGTKLGNNTIVGAGSIVKGTFPDNVVIAGTPAKIVCTLEDFKKKREKLTIIEAKEYIRRFKERNGRYPQENEMRAFFPLFLERSLKAIEDNHINLHLSGDEYEDILECFLQSPPHYASLQKLIDEAF